MKLLVKWKKKPAFHPRLRLERTGYCPAGQWVGTMFHAKAVVGMKTIREVPTLAGAVAMYFDHLAKHHEVVDGTYPEQLTARP
jgi:hypothetical protein